MSAATTDSAQASLNVAHRAPAASGSRGSGSAPLRSTEALRPLAAAGARELGDDAPALDVAQWAAQNFPDTLAVACSMADAVLPHVVSRVLPGVDVLFLDTGYHFTETVGTRDAVAATMDVTVVDVTPELSLAEQDERYGPDLWSRDPAACCRLRKVEPLARALSGYEAWATGVRREDRGRGVAKALKVAAMRALAQRGRMVLRLRFPDRAYAKHGTSVETGLLVIDRGGADGEHEAVVGEGGRGEARGQLRRRQHAGRDSS